MKLIIFVALVSVLLGSGYYKFHELTRPMPVPKLDTNKYWGPGDGSNYKPDTSIKPFKVKRDPEEIADLRRQLNRTMFLHEPLEGIRFEYGFNTDALIGIVKYWRDNYLPRWTGREVILNELPQFTTEIQGLRIHFIHSKPSEEDAANKKVIPMLLLHGWPGSVREFYDFIPMLTKESAVSDYVYEVVAPSLVGFAWSDPAAKRGFGPEQQAIVMRNLMLRLGYKKFLVQGGDWGSVIGSNIATLFPENVIGYHSNMCVLRTPLSTLKYIIADFFPDKFVPDLKFSHHHFPLKKKFEFILRESGYFHIQATKPDTIGTTLTTNPVGLMSYIFMIFQLGTGMEQEYNALESVYTLDALLDNLMIYYLSNCATTAGRIYYEYMRPEYRALNLDRVPSIVPMGCARFQNDLPSVFDWQLIDKFPNLKHSMYFNKGGHFAALEVPEMLYIAFNEFVSKVSKEQVLTQ